LLNREEVERARAIAPKVPGVQSFAELRAKAEAAESCGDRDAAARLWKWLSEIPGDGADAARERLKTFAETKNESP
jgi:hypothetical protein